MNPIINTDKKFEKKLSRQARKMSNEELRTALWEARNKTESEDDSSNKLFIMEGIYAKELKKRELLEWALRNWSRKLS